MSDASSDQPVVSVVMPMRNAEDYVVEAARSVLDQAGPALELVVVDDGSTDGSVSGLTALQDARVRIVAGPCAGISAAVNRGFEAAAGRVVMRCDADDVLLPGRVEAQVRWLDDHPEYVAVCGGFETLEPSGRRIAVMQTGEASEDITEELKAGKTRTHFGTWAVRTQAVRAVGGCRAFFTVAEDIDLQCRLACHGSVGYEPGAAYGYRLHGTSITHTSGSPRREFLTSLARQFAVERAATGQDALDRGEVPVVPDADEGEAHDAGRHIHGMLIGQAWRLHSGGAKGAAIRTACRAVTLKPFARKSWKTLAGVCMKKAMPRRSSTSSQVTA